jgi:hypothetical protein
MADKRREIDCWNQADLKATLVNCNPFKSGRPAQAADFVPQRYKPVQQAEPLFPILAAKVAMWESHAVAQGRVGIRTG